MGKLKDIGQAAKVYSSVLASNLRKKSRLSALMNRLRTVIRCEESAADKEYLALGRYYYNALRNEDDAIAEAHCARIDQIQERRDKALGELERLAQEAVKADEAASIGYISGSDGPTAVFTAGHSNGGKHGKFIYKRWVEDFPEDIADSAEEIEEIDLSDVESFDSDPMPEFPEKAPDNREELPSVQTRLPEVPEAAPAFQNIPMPDREPKPIQPAELDENDSLPFEG